MATVDIMGVTRKVSLDLVPEAVEGDFVLVHAGFALQVIDEEIANETLELLKTLPFFAEESRWTSSPKGRKALWTSRHSATPSSPGVSSRLSTRPPPAPGQDHGGVRHAHRLHRQERPARRHARDGHAALRPRLPGLRHREPRHRHRHRARAAARRHRHHLRRHDEGPGQLLLALAREGRGPRRPHRLLPARRPRSSPRRTPTSRSSSSPSASRPPPRSSPPPSSAPQERGLDELLGLLARTRRCPARSARSSTTPRSQIDAFILPGHVSTIIGLEPYRFLAEEYDVPGVITGFEPVDVLQGVYMLAQAARGGPRRDRDRLPPRRHARGQPAPPASWSTQVFEPIDADWRGIGVIPGTGLGIREEYAHYDATKRIPVDAAGAQGDQGLPVRRGAARHHAAVRVQALRHAAARPSTRSARAWSPRRAPARPTIASPTTAADARYDGGPCAQTASSSPTAPAAR